jgi:hypothetical protein
MQKVSLSPLEKLEDQRFKLRLKYIFAPGSSHQVGSEQAGPMCVEKGEKAIDVQYPRGRNERLDRKVIPQNMKRHEG